ncbi:MAG: ion channel [Bdellovibrionota bacterium]
MKGEGPSIKSEGSAIETQIFSSSLFTAESAGAQTNGAADELNRDLGFGTEILRRSRRRLLNRDGSFNVHRDGVSFLGSRSLYHTCLNVSWDIFFVSIFGAYLLVNLLFALAFFACGPGALANAATTPSARFYSCFFFSVQTFATIGYGSMSPATLAANLVVTIEALVGLLGFALATGLFFARFSRPTARILFSRHAVMAPYHGKTSFQFRIANLRSNQLMHLEVRVILSIFERSGADLKRKFHELNLERDKVMFFPLNWTIVHPISHDSPLWGKTEAELAEAQAEFLVLLAGIDDTFSQTVYATSSYAHNELVWSAKFVNILEESEDGALRIDLNRIHEIERASLPGAAAAA